MDQQENKVSNEDRIKQVIIIRKDLHMRSGKIASQSAHASMKVFFDRMRKIGPDNYQTGFTEDMESWFNGSFTKICVYVESEEEILELEKLANNANLPNAVITDNGWTEFHGVPTITCMAIGPTKSSLIDPITRELPLM
jgi:PTH2 family peptidyl-tRNA hydrolase